MPQAYKVFIRILKQTDSGIRDVYPNSSFYFFYFIYNYKWLLFQYTMHGNGHCFLKKEKSISIALVLNPTLSDAEQSDANDTPFRVIQHFSFNISWESIRP